MLLIFKIQHMSQALVFLFLPLLTSQPLVKSRPTTSLCLSALIMMSPRQVAGEPVPGSSWNILYCRLLSDGTRLGRGHQPTTGLFCKQTELFLVPVSSTLARQASSHCTPVHSWGVGLPEPAFSSFTALPGLGQAPDCPLRFLR